MWHTYFVGRDTTRHHLTHVKIGRSRNPVQRVNDLQTASSHNLQCLFILEGDREAELHAQFAKYRARGEWFHVRGELRKFILEHTRETAHAGPSFFDWLQLQLTRQDHIGRLATVVKSDLLFPRGSRKLYVLLRHFRAQYPHLIPILKRAHQEYRDVTR